MKARHKAHKAHGGEVYSGAGSKVVKEAEEHKHGGRVKGHSDEAQDKKLIAKEMGKIVGEKSMRRADKRARGGRVGGSDKSPFAPGAAKHPFSSAHKG